MLVRRLVEFILMIVSELELNYEAGNLLLPIKWDEKYDDNQYYRWIKKSIWPRSTYFLRHSWRSLDEEHKQAMLEYFWREHGQQFLIFAHSGEYKVSETMEEFGDRISKAWELKWPGDFRSCLKCKSEEVMHTKKKQITECLSCGHSWDTSVAHTVISELE